MKIVTVKNQQQQEEKPKKRFFKKKLKDPSLLKKHHIQFALSKIHFEPLNIIAKQNGFTLNDFTRNLLLKFYDANKETESSNV